jgi:hypothetical protein
MYTFREWTKTTLPWQIISTCGTGYEVVYKLLRTLTYPDVKLTTGPDFEVKQNMLEQ